MGKKKAKQWKLDKEISWLRFNERVLEESADKSVPLLERLNFVQIFTNNLADADERLAETEADKLVEIYALMREIYGKKDDFLREVRKGLEAKGIKHCRIGDLSVAEVNAVDSVFRKKILHRTESKVTIARAEDVFNPTKGIITDRAKRYILARLSADEGGTPRRGVTGINIDVDHIRRSSDVSTCYASLPLDDISRVPVFRKGLLKKAYDGNSEAVSSHEYFTEEDIVLANIDEVFAPFHVEEYVLLYIVWYEALPERVEILDINGKKISSEMKKAVIRFTGAGKSQLITTLDVESADVIDGIRDELSVDEKHELCYEPFEPRKADFSKWGSVTERVCNGDLLLSYPYDSFDTFLALLEESVSNPYTDEICITVYRMIRGGRLMKALKRAVRMGIKVRVFVELRASGDEATNKTIASELEEMGCYVYTALDDFKVHAKICQIVRKPYVNKRYITYIGTGNMNEKTAKRYTDLALITSDETIATHAEAFLREVMLGESYEDIIQAVYGSVTDEFNAETPAAVLVSPESLKKQVTGLIRRETSKGQDGRLFFKLNSITDQDIIGELVSASKAGVKVRMIVRGICSLLPGVDGCTENISIVNVVGRFLEHSRVYLAGSGSSQVMYISSADLMPRNTERRHELAVRIDDKTIRKKIERILYLNYNDDVKGRRFSKKGNLRKKTPAAKPIDSQAILIEESRINS